MHATDTTESHDTETRDEQTDSDAGIWQQYVDQNDVQLADGVTIGTLAERFPVETYDDVDTLCRRALIEIPAGRSCYELADFEAAADADEAAGTDADQHTAAAEGTARSVESDGGYQIVTGDGDDPLADDAAIEVSQDEQVATVQDEIDGVRETVDGDSR